VARPSIGRTNVGFGHSFKPGNLLTGARDERGRFMSIQTEIEEAHRRIAERLQQEVVEEFRMNLDRPSAQRPTRYLEHALAAPEAIRYNLDGFLFLPDQYLESSPATSYWRNLEEGTTQFVGRTMRGYFVSLTGVRSGPSRERYRMDAYMPQVNAAFGSHKGNRQGTIRSLSNMPVITIHNPIRAHHYLAEGIAKFKASGFQQDAYDHAFAKFASYRKGVSAKGNVVAIRG